MKKIWILLVCFLVLSTSAFAATTAEVAENAEVELPDITEETIQIEELTPFTLRTYESINDDDTQAFGFCGPDVIPWETSDIDNYGNSYPNGVKIGTNDSRYISRFAVDYKIDKTYTNFIGLIAVHVLELRSTVNYTVTILGDGQVLYTSEVINQASEAQVFVADLTGVTKLTIDICALSDNAQFYNYESVCLVDTQMELAPIVEEEETDTSTLEDEDDTEESTEEDVDEDAEDTEDVEDTEDTEEEATVIDPDSIDCSDWAKEEVALALSLNLVPTQLKADYYAPITRLDFCHLMVQAMAIINPSLGEDMELDASLQPFEDSDSFYVSLAYQLGIVNGTSDSTFEPEASILRQEAATMLSRAAEILGFTAAEEPLVFDDSDTFEDWAIAPIDFVSANGIMNGTGEDLFSPNDTYTVEESILTALRLYNLI